MGCQGQAVLRETGEQSAPPGGCWGTLINPAPGLDFCPSAHSPEGILAEWILRPGQFQGNHGALGPDRGHGTSKVTLRMGQAAHTWPPQVLGLPGIQSQGFFPPRWPLGTLFSWPQDFLKEKPVGGRGDGFLGDELLHKVWICLWL